MKFIPYENRKTYFIFAGRLDKTKGIDKLLATWKSIKDIQLIMCGIGPEEQWCKDYIIQNGMQHTVKMMGFVENSKTILMIREALALILPTQWYEGFPMSIVEAYGNGTPVLGSKIGNVGSLVIDGVTGYTFDQSSPKSILKAVNKFLDVNSSSKDLYQSTFDYYQSHYTDKENYKILSNIYGKVTTRK